MKKLLMLVFLFVMAGNVNAKINYDKKTDKFYSTPVTSDIDQSAYNHYFREIAFYYLEWMAEGWLVFSANKAILFALDNMIKHEKFKKYSSTLIRLKKDLLLNFAATGSLFG